MFRPFIHAIDVRTPSIEFRGLTLWFGRCGAAVIEVTGPVPRGRQPCPMCWN